MPEDVPSYVPSLDGVKLHMNAAMLNGSSRMAADNIATQMECDNLLRLMEVSAVKETSDSDFLLFFGKDSAFCSTSQAPSG